MKLRLALKICREQFGPRPWETMRRRRGRIVRKAVEVGQRKSIKDDRFPYVPDDEELEQQARIFIGVMAGLTVRKAEEQGIEISQEIKDMAFNLGIGSLAQPSIEQLDDEFRQAQDIEDDRRAFFQEHNLNPDDPALGSFALPEEDLEE